MSSINEHVRITVPQYGSLEVKSFGSNKEFNEFFKHSEDSINVIKLDTNVDEDHIWYTVYFKRMLNNDK